MDQWIEDLMTDLREGRAGDVAGSQGAVEVALSERLINRAIAARLQGHGTVREVTIRPERGRARVTVKLARPAFLPPVTVGLTVERQPDLPASPELVLRIEMPPALGMLLGIGANLFASLPPAVRLEGDRLRVDLHALLAARDLAWVLRYAQSLSVTFDEGRVRVQANAALAPEAA